MDEQLVEQNSEIPTYKEALLVWAKMFCIPLGVTALALIPVYFIGITIFSLHGGPGWIALTLTFPVAAFQFIFQLSTSDGPRRAWLKKFVLVAVPLYFVIAAPLAQIMRFTLAPPAPDQFWYFYSWFIFPFGMLVDLFL